MQRVGHAVSGVVVRIHGSGELGEIANGLIAVKRIWICQYEMHYIYSLPSQEERATPILSLCHNIFTDKFIFGLPLLQNNKGSSGSVTLWRQVSFLWLIIGLLRESHSREIQSKYKSVLGNVVTGSCAPQLMVSWPSLSVKDRNRAKQEFLHFHWYQLNTLAGMSGWKY